MPLIDFSGVSDGFEVIPEGIYDAHLEDWDYVEQSQSSGKPFLKLEFICDDPDYEGRKFWRNHSAQPQALWALKRTLVRLGADPEDLADEVDLDDIMPNLVGAQCRLDITVEEYNGEDRNQVKDVLQSGVTV